MKKKSDFDFDISFCLAGECKDKWLAKNNRCFYFSDKDNETANGYDDAKNKCSKMDPSSVLASIRSKEEQDFAFGKLLQL